MTTPSAFRRLGGVLGAGLLLAACGGRGPDPAATAANAAQPESAGAGPVTSSGADTAEVSIAGTDPDQAAAGPDLASPGQASPGQGNPPTTPTTLDDESGAGAEPAGPEPTAPSVAVPVSIEPQGPVVEELPPAKVGLPAVLPKNEAGAAIALDETALLACANTQFAAVALAQSQPEVAAAEFARAAARAQQSAVVEVAAAAPTLAAAMAAGDPAQVSAGFLDLCRGRGFPG